MGALAVALSLMGGAANAADLPTTKSPPPAPVKESCFASFFTYLDSTPAECPLSYWGFTVYGTIDVGYGYSSHGAKFNGDWPQGVQELIAKMNGGPKWQFVPSGLQRSNVGVNMNIPFPFAPGWSLIGNINTDFDPYSLRLANGPQSLVDNNNRTLGNQTANGDSSRAGQWDNTAGYVGVKSTTFGALTIGRQNSFSADLVTKYDPMGGAYAFSLIGNSSTYVSGVGDTETTRYNSVIKYLVGINNFRVGGLWQFGGYSFGNGSNDAYQVDVGADYGGFSIDAIYSYASDAVALSTYAQNPLPAGVSIDDLKATLADISGEVVAAKYTFAPFQVFGGYEHAVFSNPSDAYPLGIDTLGDFKVLPGGLNTTAYTTHKILQVGWVGAKYQILTNLDITGAYYLAHQDAYLPAGSASSVCAPNNKSAIPGSSPQGTLNTYCAGDLQAVSAMLDYRPLKRMDLYGGFMYSIASGGIASGYIHSQNWAPTVGLRVSF